MFDDDSTPVAELSLTSVNASMLGRILWKSNLTMGTIETFTFDMLDKCGHSIRFIAFGNLAKKFYPIIEEGAILFIEMFDIRSFSGKTNFSTNTSNLELVFNENTTVGHIKKFPFSSNSLLILKTGLGSRPSFRHPTT